MKDLKQHILEKLKISAHSELEEKIANRRSKTTIKDKLALTLPNKLHFKAWVDDMIVADDFAAPEPLDSLISFLPNKNGVIFWNYNFRKGMEPEIIDGIVIDGSMTFGEAYEVILRFIHDKYKDKDDIFTI
jgi:hypothetical protein